MGEWNGRPIVNRQSSIVNCKWWERPFPQLGVLEYGRNEQQTLRRGGTPAAAQRGFTREEDLHGAGVVVEV